MRWVVGIVGVLLLLYCGWWFVGERVIEREARAALDRLEAEGWTVGYERLNTTGFPSRFDTTVTEVEIASPDGQAGWSAPIATLYQLSYRPNRAILYLPETQTVTAGGRAFEVASEGLRASGGLGLSRDAPFRDLTVESGPLTVTGEGVEAGADRLLLAARAAAAPAAYDLFAEAEGIAALGNPALDLLRIDGTVTLDRPLDRYTRGQPSLVALTLREARLALGEAAVTAEGALAPDAEGFLAGEIVVRVADWEGAVASLEAAGVVTGDRLTLLRTALGSIAQGEDIEVPITFAEGRISALGLSLLEAPRVQRQ